MLWQLWTNTHTPYSPSNLSIPKVSVFAEPFTSTMQEVKHRQRASVSMYLRGFRVQESKYANPESTRAVYSSLRHYECYILSAVSPSQAKRLQTSSCLNLAASSVNTINETECSDDQISTTLPTPTASNSVHKQNSANIIQRPRRSTRCQYKEVFGVQGKQRMPSPRQLNMQSTYINDGTCGVLSPLFPSSIATEGAFSPILQIGTTVNLIIDINNQQRLLLNYRRLSSRSFVRAVSDAICNSTKLKLDDLDRQMSFPARVRLSYRVKPYQPRGRPNFY